MKVVRDWPYLTGWGQRLRLREEESPTQRGEDGRQCREETRIIIISGQRWRQKHLLQLPEFEFDGRMGGYNEETRQGL